MSAGPLIFMLTVWAIVLGLMGWSFARLMKADAEHEQLPPPGSIP